MIVQLDKQDPIVTLFRQIAVKHKVLQAVVSSANLDALSTAESISLEIVDLEDVAWNMIYAAYPETAGKQCQYHPYPPSVRIVGEV